MRFLIALAALATFAAPASAHEGAHGDTQAEHVAAHPALTAAVNGAWRPQTDRARDQYRHPSDSLTFWGLPARGTIVEIQPGGGSWWTKILAPFAHTTGGRYIAAQGDLAAPNASENARNGRANFLSEYADTSIYGTVQAVDFGMHSGLALPDNSADFILVARSVHGWAGNEGMTDRFMSEFARVLRSGGVLAVEQHRAADGADVTQTASTGYIPESYVIAAAERAGLTLAARSEINANPRDDRDHPFGVWTLPPVRQSAANGEQPAPDFDRAGYDAIGESDRMTLRFVKP